MTHSVTLTLTPHATADPPTRPHADTPTRRHADRQRPATSDQRGLDVSHPGRRTITMTRIFHPRPTHRPCSWCASEFVIACRPGRPRLYCNHACRQRAYEHRHGFEHQRTVRPLPAQVAGDSWTGSGYERGGSVAPLGRMHAMRTSVRPEGSKRETLCGTLVRPNTGQHFSAMHPRACRTCTTVADSNPLRYGISASNELSRLRSLLDDIEARRIKPGDALSWIRANSP